MHHIKHAPSLIWSCVIALVIVETTDSKGSLHSSYLLVNGLEHRSVIDNLVVAIHQSPAGQKHQRRQQPADELPSDDTVATAESNDKDEGQEDDAEDDEDEIKAHNYVDCQSVGIISLAGSLRHMIQQSPSATLLAVNILECQVFCYS